MVFAGIAVLAVLVGTQLGRFCLGLLLLVGGYLFVSNGVLYMPFDNVLRDGLHPVWALLESVYYTSRGSDRQVMVGFVAVGLGIAFVAMSLARGKG
jgi:hypothetical protein